MKTAVKIDRFYIPVKPDRTWFSGYGQVYEVTTEPGAPCQAC